uniref:Uncharacterized protein n=1 Tax=Euplotes harpa TaxID=151035 RepID=A0A7S3JB58_9SPIT|mmetsp:Transcript_30505/g.34938  ORF Transcript_30505/g.34938 Transcript_30505/m.34938 type:complete len:147 (+) Transcript_30505:323-763(+)
MVKISHYIDSLEDVLAKVTKEAYLDYFIYTKDDFERTVKACHNAARIVFRGSKIELTQDMDFSGPSYKAEYFSVEFCGDYKQEEWSESPGKLEIIIRAISNCGLRDTLRTFNVISCGLSVYSVTSLFKLYEMPDVEVVEVNPGPQF